MATKYEESVRNILRLEAENILTLMETLDQQIVSRVIDLMLTVKPSGVKVITAGCGTSGTLARRVAHTLSVVEVPALYCSPANSIHGGTGVIQKGDVAVLFSKGGNTPEILNYLPICKAKGALIIGVSQNDDSTLAKAADIYLKIQVDHEADPWNLCASASCNAIAAVWDAIAFTVMVHSGYTMSDLYLTHPGGGVGQILAAQGK